MPRRVTPPSAEVEPQPRDDATLGGDIEFCRNVDKTHTPDGRGMAVRFVRHAWSRRDCDERTIADVIYGRSAADNAAAAR